MADILARLTASEAANASLNAEVQRQAALGQQTQAQLVTTLSQLPAQLAQAVASGRPDPGQKSMIDARGLGKPRNFQNDEKDFIQWARKLENYVVSVHRNARTILAYATECTDAVDVDDCKLALPSVPVAEVDELVALKATDSFVGKDHFLTEVCKLEISRALFGAVSERVSGREVQEWIKTEMAALSQYL